MLKYDNTENGAEPTPPKKNQKTKNKTKQTLSERPQGIVGNIICHLLGLEWATGELKLSQ